MARRVVVVDPAVAKRCIAETVLGGSVADAALGRVRLRPHQRDAVTRIRRAICDFGGALLADSVGLGKAYVALAVARTYTHATVVGPAVLRSTWARAAEEAAANIEYRTMEALSRGSSLPRAPGIVIVDEAHHFRTPSTRRYASLARLTAGVPVVLLSATPVHNTRRDLGALLALFLGEDANTIPDSAIAMCVIRREAVDVAAETQLPRLRAGKSIRTRDDSRIVAMLCALPPPLPPRDGGLAADLIARSLVHQWASSDAALRAAIRRRLGAARALSQALAAGRIPSRRELASWTLVGDSVQLGFPEFLVAGEVFDPSAALGAVEAHTDALRSVLARVQPSGGRDFGLAERVRDIRDRHADEKIVAFSQYAATVNMLFGSLNGAGRVAALVNTRAQIASGRITRDQAIRLFRDPRAGTARRVDLLLTTDVLSEGVNLPEASVIVHLDLPWTAARLEQRVGRARRLGAMISEVTVYSFTPPTTAERYLRNSGILEAKSDLAARTVGRLEIDEKDRCAASAPRNQERLRRLLAEWQPVDCRALRPATCTPASTLVAGMRSPVTGFLALVDHGVERFLIAAVPSGAPDPGMIASDDPGILCTTASGASDTAVEFDAQSYRQARRAIAAWLAERSAASLTQPANRSTGSAHTAAINRLDRIVSLAPPSVRPVVAARASGLRMKLQTLRGAGIELALRDVLGGSANDLIPRLERFVTEYSCLSPIDHNRRTQRKPRVIAVLLLRAEQAGSGAAPATPLLSPPR